MSTYFNGSAFRAIDALATTDGEHVTSALEAQQVNNAHYLHINDAGQITRVYPTRQTTASTSDGMWSHASTLWSPVLYMPFLVLRGLKSISITWHGKLVNADSDVRLELLGVGYVDALWTYSGGLTETRTVTLTLPQSSEYEVDTDLILWHKSTVTGSAFGTVSAGSIISQRVECGNTSLSTGDLRCIVHTNGAGTDGNAAVTPLEPIVRALAVTLASGVTGDIGIIVDEVEGAGVRFNERGISGVLTRSISIKTLFE